MSDCPNDTDITYVVYHDCYSVRLPEANYDAIKLGSLIEADYRQMLGLVGVEHDFIYTDLEGTEWMIFDHSGGNDDDSAEVQGLDGGWEGVCSEDLRAA